MPRADGINLTIIVGQVRADIPETRLASAPSSTLQMDRSPAGGTLSFRGLVSETSGNQPVGEPIDLEGTLTWTCDEGLSSEG